MSARWSGPWCKVLLHDGTAATFDPVPLQAPALPAELPLTAVRAVTVRWRVGTGNPRKATFKTADAAAAQALARRLAEAARTGADAGTDGRPVDAAVGHPQPERSSPPPGVAVPPATSATTEGMPGAEQSAHLSGHGSGDGHGRTIAEYVDELVALHTPRWNEHGDAAWWRLQLGIVAACMTYAQGDPRLDRFGVPPGSSLHFAAVQTSDFERALEMRRCTNLAARRLNEVKLAKYERQQAEYQRKLAAFEAGTGPRGRKPVPPKRPELAVEYEPNPAKPLISARTEEAFRMATSFIFDRAFDAGLLPPGPNVWRTYCPRGSGGRASSKRTPYRRASPGIVSVGTLPPAAFFVDLGDAVAERGADLEDGRRAGERYRILPLTAWHTLVRPEDLPRLLKAGVRHGTPAHLAVVADPGDHLKASAEGATRPVELAQLAAALLQRHIDSGFGTDRRIYASPYGAELDLSNWLEDYLRPAARALTAPGGLWPEYGELHIVTNITRKAGITALIEYGLDSREVARRAGHDEMTLLRDYRSVLDVHRGQRAWRGYDAMIAEGLADMPPRGDGALAVELRAWSCGY